MIKMTFRFVSRPTNVRSMKKNFLTPLILDLKSKSLVSSSNKLRGQIRFVLEPRLNHFNHIQPRSNHG